MTTRDAGYDRDLAAQIASLQNLLSQNKIINEVLKRASALVLPNWYLGAGCLAQTVWNVLHGFDPCFGIKDYDLVYYDSSDISSNSEENHAKKANVLFADLNVALDVKNEARVHLWYAEHFGYGIPPYQSVEHAITTWPTTATSVAISTGTDGMLKVCAPFGLNDLLGMIVRPNKTQITRAIYEEKVARWIKLWPQLRIISWEQ